MFTQMFDWVLSAIEDMVNSMPDIWAWLNTDIAGLGIKPLAIFGFSGLAVVLGVLIVHFIAIWS